MVDGRLVVGGFGAWCLALLLGRRWALENPLAHTDKDTMASSSSNSNNWQWHKLRTNMFGGNNKAPQVLTIMATRKALRLCQFDGCPCWAPIFPDTFSLFSPFSTLTLSICLEYFTVRAVLSETWCLANSKDLHWISQFNFSYDWTVAMREKFSPAHFASHCIYFFHWNAALINCWNWLELNSYLKSFLKKCMQSSNHYITSEYCEIFHLCYALLEDIKLEALIA